MKIKTILTLSALAAAGAATAAVSSTNTLCRIAVNSGMTNTIIGVSLAKIGTTSNESLPVSSMVLTDNLNVGDLLLHKNGSTWDAWIITETDSSKKWEPLPAAEGQTLSYSEPTDSVALERGDALWVKRVSGSDDLTKPFYIYGQVGNVTSYKEISVAAGTSEAPVYTLIGNPQLQAFPLSALVPGSTYIASGEPHEGDKIVFGAANAFGFTEYQWRKPSGSEDCAWCYEDLVENGTKIGWVASSASIGPGEGCWYVSVGGNPAIQWKDN